MKLLLLFAVCGGLYAQVAFVKGHDRVDVTIDGKPFTTYFFDPTTNKPYLHPLRSASGKVVTRHYPMENVPGEDTEHPHHRGVAFTHGEVNGLNFWASEPSQANSKQGRILLDNIEKMESGKQRGDIVTAFRWVDQKGKVVLREHRTTTFYANPTLRIVDFDIELRAGAEPVRFADTKEGTFYVRLGKELSEDTGGKMVSSTGASAEKNVWGTRADWVDDYGVVGGEALGVAVFDHPENLRHPTYWHSRAYGLLAANPFGWHDFLKDPKKDGSFTIAPGKSVRFRYRVVVHPGNTASAGIDKLYREYTQSGGSK